MAGALSAGCARGAEAKTLTVYKSSTCGCCGAWTAHMIRAGFAVKTVETDDLAAVRKRLGVPDQLASCHTAVAGGYFVEGHVPASDVERLLRERPVGARGLAVPGMPVGSPGMEAPGGQKEPYQVILLTASGPKVFSRH